MNSVQTIYYKGRRGTTMRVNSFDIPYWLKQGWTTQPASSSTQTTSIVRPISRPTSRPIIRTISRPTSKPNDIQTIYYKGRRGTTMRVHSFDVPHWAKQGWTTQPASSSTQTTSIAKPTPKPVVKTVSKPTPKPVVKTVSKPTPKPVSTSMPDSLYIGSTNWANLQKKYSPEQLNYATIKKNGKRYWNPNKHIEDYKPIPKSVSIPTVKSTPKLTSTPALTTTAKITSKPATTEQNNYQAFLMKQIEQQNQYLKDYIDTLKKQPNLTDVYKQYSQQLGLPQQQQQVKGLQQQVLDVEELLNKLESDINQRISGHLVTEPLRRRYLATEGKPLRTQLADLTRAETRARAGYSGAKQELANMLKLYEQDQARKEKLASLPLQYGYKNLPYYKEMINYQSPEQKLNNPVEKTNLDKTMLAKGYKYITTPALRDKLKAKGYDIINIGGRTYGKAPKATSQSATKLPMSYREWSLAGKPGTYASWVKRGKEKTRGINKNQIKNDTISKMREYAGADGYVSPNTYKTLKTAWRRRGYNITVGDFDKLFSSTFVNPTHPQDYGIKTKTKTKPRIK